MHFVPENLARSSYRGYVRLHDAEFAVRVSNVVHDTCTNRMVLEYAQLDVDRALATHLTRHHATLKLRLVQASSLDDFGAELTELIALACRDVTSDAKLPYPAYYNRLVAELDVVGWHQLRHVSDDLRTLELELEDARGRKHAIKIQLPLEYADEGSRVLPTCLVDAPERLELEWPRETTSCVLLHEVRTQFQHLLETFQAFWDVLDALDAAACVLEPQHPTRATGRRRIALARHVSLQFQVDPAHPRALVQDVQFFGIETRVGALRERWQSVASSSWQATRSVVENVQAILNVTVPSPSTHARHEFAMECGICYLYRLQDQAQDDKTTHDDDKDNDDDAQLPDLVCDNGNCQRPFHAKCLVDWLRAVPTSRQSFRLLFGECPYCREAISAKYEPAAAG
ncbi:hypothetical protein PsorP6_017992 [Peronosclerospora sorghi]|uniref:Uncharacterized protein n=1 Tax=Peronosclerospora sorghi TaxID=230839 RepID=A0ACC0WFY1_9STRA|nr:hypothetical protein PsorP6_017992 [Peronosclerospora sorghi]